MGIDYRVLGQKIQARRKALHLTQESVAESLSVTVGYVSQIERGITRVNLEMLSRMGELLGSSAADFLGGAEENTAAYLSDDLDAVFRRLSATNRKILMELSEVLLQNQ